MKYIKDLYNWVLHWANTPFGVPALLILSFTESSVFPVPPDVLLIALTLGAPRKAFYFATICTAGSVLGGLFGYLIGHQFWEWAGPIFLNYIFPESLFIKVQGLYHQYEFWAVFVSGFTPIPYKVFTISAGVFGLNIFNFTLASIVGRGLRFFLVGALIFKFGPSIKLFIDKYFGWVTFVFTALLIGGFIFVKWILGH